MKGTPELNRDVMDALLDLFIFWFALAWNLTLLISLFRGVKHLFNRCYEGYVLKLLTCKGD